MNRRVQRRSGSAQQRGLAMIMVLFLILLALVVTLAVLANAGTSASSTLSVQTKNQTFNAAETGLDAAIYNLDANHGIADGTKDTGTVDGYTYTWEVIKNNVSGAGQFTPNEIDPAVSGTVTVGPQQAYVAGWASSITGGRTVYSEAMVHAGPPITFTPGAIVSGQTAQISHDPISDTTGNHSANIHAHQITSSGGGQIPDGNTYAVCSVNGCNAIIGQDGQAHINQPPAFFLTAAQLASVQSSALTQAQSGPPNVYVNGDWTSAGTWGTAASNGNCTVYINGNVILNGSGMLTNYCNTVVVTGNWTMSGSAQYAIAPASAVHATYVLGTSGTVFNGTVNTAGFMYSANGPITLNGDGNGSFTGVLYSPYNVTMNGGGSANFYYNPIQSTVQYPNPNVVTVAQWEY